MQNDRNKSEFKKKSVEQMKNNSFEIVCFIYLIFKADEFLHVNIYKRFHILSSSFFNNAQIKKKSMEYLFLVAYA